MIADWVDSFLHLLYPPLCLHCTAGLGRHPKLFCEDCLRLLELIDPLSRCPYCFSADFSPNVRACAECQRNGSLFDRMASAFDYEGPAATLARRMKYADQPYLSKGAAAWMAAQFIRLDWPFPDGIVPVPLALTHLIDRGYNQSFLIAEELAQFLQRPVVDCLQRSSGDYSQAGLSRKQRLEFNSCSLSLRKGADIKHKTLLLVDDVRTTGKTLQHSAYALMEGCPQKIFALVLCRAMG